VARAYDIRWLVLNRADSVPAMTPILDGAGWPEWLGRPIFANGQGSALDLAVFPVCTQVGDSRCGRSTP
jgi:hypothetical protein